MNTTSKNKSDDEKVEDVEAITAEIARLRGDLASLVDTVGRVGRSRARGLASTAQSKADEHMVKGEAMLGEISGELQRLENDLVVATRESPFRALGIAAALGFLLALFVRR